MYYIIISIITGRNQIILINKLLHKCFNSQLSLKLEIKTTDYVNLK